MSGGWEHFIQQVTCGLVPPFQLLKWFCPPGHVRGVVWTVWSGAQERGTACFGGERQNWSQQEMRVLSGV